MSFSKKKLNIGINNEIEKINICKSFTKTLDRLSSGKKPPADILVNDILNASRSLRSTKLYKKITKIVKLK
tara:strand:+ start:289 stop:501 length:213 start_codon:yes stop_codon:yes gene_type:complete